MSDIREIDPLLLFKLGMESAYRDEQTLSFSLRKKIISHPAFISALRRMARLHSRWRYTGNPGGLLLTGQSGSGKSTAIGLYARAFPKKEAEDRSIIPVLLISMPSAPTVKSLTEEILIKLGDPFYMKGTAEERTKRIYYFFRECKVELLVIDEFQHVLDSGKGAQVRYITDWLKNLLEESSIPAILTGMPRSELAIRSNPQLARRFSSQWYMRPFSINTSELQLEFRGVLKQLQELLPTDSIDLHSPDMMRRFFYASAGLIDYVVKIIDWCVSQIGIGIAKRIDCSLLAEAFCEEIWRDCPESLNPFLPDAKLRLLTFEGEPFCNLDNTFVATNRSHAARNL